MGRSNSFLTVLVWTLSASLFTFSSVAGAQEGGDSDWKGAADADVVEILTENADGSARKTKIWVARVEDDAFIRTGGTRWYRNIERDPNLVLRIQEAEFPMRAELVAEERVLTRVEAEFRRKYGFRDRLAGLFRFGGTHILRLVPRHPE
jgi:hypothetical protein